MPNAIRKWLKDNVSHNDYQKIFSESANQLGISEVQKNKDLTGKYYMPYSRQVMWANYIREYNEKVTFEALFPKVNLIEKN